MKLSELIARKYNISKRLAKNYIKQGFVKIKEKTVKHNVEITKDIEVELTVKRTDIDYSLNDFLINKYQDVVFLYKPPFMHSERQKLEDELTISDIVEKSFENYKLISRLDFETDGVIAAVKSNYSIKSLLKKYLAIGVGNLSETIILKNIIDYKKRKKVKITNRLSEEYTTIIKPIKYNKDYTLIEISLEKAQRHQIRAYLSHLGIPILGDRLYGNHPFKRMMLSCVYTKINDFDAASPSKNSFIKTFNEL